MSNVTSMKAAGLAAWVLALSAITRPLRAFGWLAVAAGGLFGAPVQASVIEGQASWREGLALPPGAVFQASLVDLSAPGGVPVRVLSRSQADPAGVPPVRFRFDVADDALAAEGRYAVRAAVMHEGRLLFVTEAPVPLPAADAAGQRPALDLRLVPVRRAAEAASPEMGTPMRSAAPVLSTSWPAAFAGELPGASGAVTWQLRLFAEGRFELRRRFDGRPEPNAFDDIGRWRLLADEAPARLELVGTDGERTFFAVLDDAGTGRTPRALRLLDRSGEPIASPLPYSLQPVSSAGAPPELRLQRLSGLFSYWADAARITLCADERQLPVALEGDMVALQRAYLEALDAQPGAAPGDPLKVELDARIALRPQMEDSLPPVASVVPERFIAVWPRETCGTPQAETPLEGTLWRLTRLEGAPVQVAERQREPYLILNASTRQLSGSGGCNGFATGYTLAADRLEIRPAAATLRACPEGMAQEQRFLRALSSVAGWRTVGSHLDLLDDRGQVLARLEALYLR